ncbi:MAG: YceH family protein [Acidimicrobiales bacterium]
MILSSVGARILGSLVEKQLTTPQQYPLTGNALLLACNQASNREPVVMYSDDELSAGLDELRQQHLVRFVLPSHGRSVVRYRHVLDEVLGIDETSLALLAVLVLRGPQTPGELRTRTGRMVTFANLEEVERHLAELSERDEPLVRCIGRRPGQKEDRWVDLLHAGSNPVVVSPDQSVQPEAGSLGAASSHAAPFQGGSLEDTGVWWAELDKLKAEVHDLREAVDELRSSLGG